VSIREELQIQMQKIKLELLLDAIRIFCAVVGAPRTIRRYMREMLSRD
jgi:hypothetical protein